MTLGHSLPLALVILLSSGVLQRIFDVFIILAAVNMLGKALF